MYSVFPSKCFRKRLSDEGTCTEEEIAAIEEKIENEIEEAVEYAQAEPDPAPEDALKNAYVEEGLL